MCEFVTFYLKKPVFETKKIYCQIYNNFQVQLIIYLYFCIRILEIYQKNTF